MIPDLGDDTERIPTGSLELGDGYRLLPPRDTAARPVSSVEMEAVKVYMRVMMNQNYDGSTMSIRRWGRVRLPNGQIVRSRWKEEQRQTKKIRISRNVKVRQGVHLRVHD